MASATSSGNFTQHPKAGDTITASQMREHFDAFISIVDRYVAGYGESHSGASYDVTIGDGVGVDDLAIINGNLVGKASDGTQIVTLSNTGSTWHIYLRSDGVIEANDTGVDPADSIKLYTAETDGSGVTSVTSVRDDTITLADPLEADTLAAVAGQKNISGGKVDLSLSEPEILFEDTTDGTKTVLVARNGALEVRDEGGGGGRTTLVDDLRSLVPASGGTFTGAVTINNDLDVDNIIVDNQGAGSNPTLDSNFAAQTLRLTGNLTLTKQLLIPTTGSSGGAVIGGDANLYRSAADTLKTDDHLIAADGVQTFTKAGVPADVDFTVTPADGTLAVDTSSSLLYFRSGVDTWNVAGAKIGAPVSGGTATDILFVDGSGNLGQNANLQYDSSPDELQLGTGTTVVWAGDTNLYRDSANTLKTDDSLSVGGSLTLTGSLTFDGAAQLTGATSNAFVDLDSDGWTTGGGDNVLVSSRNNVAVVVDSDASGTGGEFIVGKDATDPGGAGWVYLARVNENGRLTLATNGSAAGIQVGTDVQMYRGGSDTLYLASGDNIRLVSGQLQFASDTVLERSAADTLHTPDNLVVDGDLTLGSAQTMVLPQTTADYTVSWNDPGASRALTIEDPGGADTFAYLAATQTFTNKTIDTASNTITVTSSDVSDFSEAVDDRVNALLVDGDGLTATYNDVGNSLTLDVNVGQGLEIATDNVQVANDAITGAMLAPAVAGAGLVQDGSGNLDINPGTGMEINADAIRIASGAAGAGLGYSAGVLSVNAGSGITVSGDAVNADVTSVFGRTGAVSAQSGDYSHSQLSGIGSSDHHTRYSDSEAQAAQTRVGVFSGMGTDLGELGVFSALTNYGRAGFNTNTTDGCGTPVTKSGTVGPLRVTLIQTNVAGDMTVHLIKNGSRTGLSVSFDGSEAAGTQKVDSGTVSVSAGDNLGFEWEEVTNSSYHFATTLQYQT